MFASCIGIKLLSEVKVDRFRPSIEGIHLPLHNLKSHYYDCKSHSPRTSLIHVLNPSYLDVKPIDLSPLPPKITLSMIIYPIYIIYIIIIYIIIGIMMKDFEEFPTIDRLKRHLIASLVNYS